jgi:hypothetical protein
MALGERTGNPRSDAGLSEDLAHAAELVASAQALEAIARRHGLKLTDVRRARLDRLVRELVEAADAVDGAMLGWVAAEVELESRDLR